MDHDPSPPPDILEERFETLGILGQGAFGRVLHVRERATGDQVALKLLADSIGRGQAAARFRREARLASEIVHPNLVPVLDYGLDDRSRAWIAYRLVQGESLDVLLGWVETLPPPKVVAWGTQLAAALACLHDHGVIHRDVKPENILVESDEVPVLCDLGLARVEGGSTVQTEHGLIMGTPAYLAPEVWTGSPASEASDQFALAAVLFQMVTGERVFGDRVEPLEVLELVRDGWEGPAREVLAVAPPGLAAVLLRALARDPASRFPAMTGFRDALQIADLTMSPADLRHGASGRPPPPEAARRPARPRVLLVGGLVVGAALAGWSSSGLLRPGPPPTPLEPSAQLAAHDSRQLAALEAAHRELLSFLGGHRAPDGTHQLTWEPRHEDGMLDAVLDPRFEFKWRRYLDALVAWTRITPEAPPETALAHRAWLDHILRDLRALEIRSQFDGVGNAGDLARHVEVHAALRRTWEDLLTRCEGAAAHLRASGLVAPHQVLVEGILLRFAADGPLEQVLRELSGHLVRDHAPALRAEISTFLLEVAWSGGPGSRISCPTALDVARRVGAMAITWTQAEVPGLAFLVEVRTLELLTALAARCPEFVDEADHRWIRDALDRISSGSPESETPPGRAIDHHLREAVREFEELATPPRGPLGSHIQRIREILATRSGPPTRRGSR